MTVATFDIGIYCEESEILGRVEVDSTDDLQLKCWRTELLIWDGSRS